ncbi:hypothetical protein CHU95_01520 [Niveispirillum lacus]|uniref:SpoVT-AbrB domain-containing protein n=1 Tax=Niveispirillum lacus TaxID=1981099 RepID=A0A255Z9V4_9PROT|nr:hypothetical protein [Niveispirillum lacus]OYQ37400.1 hypothetical protein CHU95_01520 [Niveispirillum lacus]
MEVTIGPDGTISLTAEMLAHLRTRPGEKLSVFLTADHRLELAPPAKAPGEKLLQTMLGRTAKP